MLKRHSIHHWIALEPLSKSSNWTWWACPWTLSVSHFFHSLKLYCPSWNQAMWVLPLCCFLRFSWLFSVLWTCIRTVESNSPVLPQKCLLEFWLALSQPVGPVREYRVSLILDYMSPTRGGFSSASQMLSGFHHRVLAYLSLKYSLAISFLYTVINGIFLNIHFPIVCCWLVGKLLNFCKVTTLPESWMNPSFLLGICLWIDWTFCVHIHVVWK